MSDRMLTMAEAVRDAMSIAFDEPEITLALSKTLSARYKSGVGANCSPVAHLAFIKADFIHQKRLWGRSTLHRRFSLTLKEEL